MSDVSDSHFWLFVKKLGVGIAFFGKPICAYSKGVARKRLLAWRQEEPTKEWSAALPTGIWSGNAVCHDIRCICPAYLKW